MTDLFSTRSASLNGPARDYLPVVPDDATALPGTAVALYVETGGQIAFVSAAGQTRSVVVADGGWILCGVRKVLATGTTADGIHALVH